MHTHNKGAEYRTSTSQSSAVPFYSLCQMCLALWAWLLDCCWICWGAVRQYIRMLLLLLNKKMKKNKKGRLRAASSANIKVRALASVRPNYCLCILQNCKTRARAHQTWTLYRIWTIHGNGTPVPHSDQPSAARTDYRFELCTLSEQLNIKFDRFSNVIISS